MSLTPDTSDPVLISSPAGATAGADSVKSARKKRRKARLITAAVLIGILFIAAFFRFYGRDFDQGHNQHPDERYIVGKTIALTWPQTFDQFFNTPSSPINLRAVDPSHPQGDHYPYGSFPVYLVKFTGWLADSMLPHTSTAPKGYYLTDYNGVTQLGRTLASIFDLITVFLVFLIGRRLYSTKAGLVAAALVAFSVTNIQIAHFYASDVFLVTFMMGAVYFSVLLMQKPSWYAALGAGACIGLAVASKVSVVPFALIVLAAVALRAAYRKRTRALGAELGDPIGVKPATNREREMSFLRHLWGGLGYLVIAGVASLLFFSISEPYVLLLPALNYIAANGIGSVFTGLAGARDAFIAAPFYQGILEQAGIQSGQADVPYTRQYIGTVPLLYQIQNMVMWGLSPIPGLVVLVGFAAGLWNALRRRPAEILLMAGAIPYFATILTLEAKWMRYMLPLVPIFCILGAALLMRGVAWMAARARRRPVLRYSRRPFIVVQRNVFQIITALAVGGAFLWSVAFMNIYSQEHSRVQASRWFYDNVPTTINDNGQTRPVRSSGEDWDDFLPLGVAPTATQAGHDNGAYQQNAVHYGIYDDRPPDQEFEYLKGLMQQTDYIVLASNRLYGSIRHEPWRYPVQIQFYNLLFSGKLGFELVHTTQVTPSLFGINFNDQSADESFTVYDHPRVDIFKKTANLTDEQLHILFSDALTRPPQDYIAARYAKIPDDNSLQYNEPVSTLGDTNDFQWNPLFQPDTQWTGVLLWLALVEILGIIMLPIVLTICKRLPDRGYPIAKILGPVLLAWGIYVLSSAHLVPFTVWGIALVLLVLIGLSILCWRLGGRETVREFVRKQRKLIVYYEILFFAAFGFMLLIKMLYPDLWGPVFGGERPMEFGFLNSVMRSPWMPAADPFFSNGYINYYYYGQFMMAVMMKLLGADTGVGVSLAMALLFAFTFTAGASIAYNIVAWIRTRRVPTGALREISTVGMAFGVIAGVLMLLIGNMHGIFQLIMITNPSLGGQLIDFARTHGLTEQAWLTPVTSFDFWGPSRIISHTINEFPYWSFLYGDFHPHLIDMAFTMCSVVLALNLAFAGPFRGIGGIRGTRNRIGAALAWLWGDGWSGVLFFGIVAVLLGTLFATNSWDFPTYAGIVGAGVLVALLVAHVGLPEAARMAQAEGEAAVTTDVTWTQRGFLWVSAIVTTALLALAGVIAALPFLLSFKNVLSLAIRPLIDGGPLPDNPGVLMHRTTLGEYLMMWALFVFVAFSYLVVRLWAFPWAAAASEIAALFGGRSPASRPVPSAPAFRPDAAFSLLPSRERLTPALAGAGTGPASTVHFASGTRESDQPELRFGQESAGTTEIAPVTEPDPGIGNTEQVTARESVLGDDIDGTAIGEDGQKRTDVWTQPQLAPDAVSEQTPTSNGAPVDDKNWIAAAHEQSGYQAALVVPRQQIGVIPAWAGLGMLAITAGITLVQLATGQWLLALLVALLGGIAATSLSTSRSASGLFTGVLLVAALAVSIGVELVWVADHLRGGDTYRMNTVFKFYIQVWLLYGVGSAAAIYYILFGVREPKEIALKATDPHASENGATPAAEELLHQANIEGAGAAVAGAENSAVQHDDAAETAVSGITPLAATNGHTSSEPNGTSIPAITEPLDNWLVWSDLAAVAPIAPEPPAEAVEPFWLAEEELPAEPEHPVGENGFDHAEDASELPLVEPVPAREFVEPDPPSRWSSLRLALTSAWTVAFAILLLCAGVFTLYGTQARVNARFPVNPPFGTLDGRAYLQTGTYGPINSQGGDGANGQSVMVNLKYDDEGIQWLNKNVPGLRVIFEGPYEYYRDGGMRVAANTGLPMIVGGLHQEEQRYDWQVGNRRGEANELLTTADPQIALTLISKYNIDYIYLGQLEQARAGNGMAKFEQLAKAGLLKRVCCTTPPEGILGTIIYQVVKNNQLAPEKVEGAPVQGSGVAGISFTPLPTPSPTPAPTPPTNDPQLKALTDAVAANPTNIESEQNLVNWYRDHQYFLAAATQLEQMVKQRPQDIAIRHQLGDAYQSAGQPDKALQEWKAAVDIEPDNPAAHNKLGLGYLDRHQYDDAITEFKTALQKDPNFNEADLHLGEAYDGKGQHDDAVKAYQQAIDAWNKAPADRKQGMEAWANEAKKRLGQ